MERSLDGNREPVAGQPVAVENVVTRGSCAAIVTIGNRITCGINASENAGRVG
jgi:hypothetical protein